MGKKEKAQKALYKKWWFWIVVVCLVGAIGNGFSGDNEPAEPSAGQQEMQASVSAVSKPSKTPEANSVETMPELESENIDLPETLEPDLAFELDTLQSGFVSISEDTTIDEILSFIEENSLFYTAQEYNKLSGGKTVKYKIAYEQGVSYQSHADSGDYLEISFDKDNDNTIQNAEYVNSHSYGYSALFYNYGTWYSFDDDNAEDYTGYYNVKSLGGNDEGIVIKYNNGNEAHTNYFLCNSPEEAVENILRGITG